jgi:hypothetical protein
MTVQKMLIGGIIAGSLVFSAGPVLALAWDWPYPWADPKEAAQDRSAVRGQSDATASDRRQPEFVASREEVEKDRRHTAGDKNALRDDRNDLSNDRSELNRDRRELHR